MTRRPEWQRAEVHVGGAWRIPRTAATGIVEDPATEEHVGTAAEAGVDDVDDAVRAARQAFGDWGRSPVKERVEVLRGWHDLLLARHDLLVDTTVAEVGAPFSVAKHAHVGMGLAVLEAYLDEAASVAWEEPVGTSVVLREPIGVAACITPWNWPLYQVLAKIGGALVAGCTVVLKPAELTPLSAYLLMDAALEAGLPAGVLNLVPGKGAIVGEAMARHPDVDVVSFTGSTGVGAHVSATAAQSIKRVCLELGGKSSSVVLDDADLAAAVHGSVAGAMLNSGQTCSAWSRLLVPRARYAEAVEIAGQAVADLRIGDPRDEATDLGPVISEKQRADVVGHVARAVADGARVVTGGTVRPSGRGHFVTPTVLADVPEGAVILTEEVFGPVLTVESCVDQDDAVRRANATPYGLHGAVWSADEDRAFDVARRLRTGQVDLNGAVFNPAAPFGGYGRSGNGREMGRWGIEDFLEIKSVQR